MTSRPFRVRSIVVLTAAVGTLLVPGTAHAGGSTSLSIDATVAVSGTPKPYRLHLHASHFGTLVNTVSVQLTRTATTGNKPTVFTDYTASDSTVHCAPDLSSCELDTGTHMGGYGRIHLTFHATAAAKSRNDLCNKTGEVLSRTTTRKGTLTGSLAVDTLTDYFKKVTNKNTPVHVPHVLNATAQKFTSFNRNCPGGGPLPCTGFLQLSGSWLSADSSLVLGRPLPSGAGRISLFQPFASGVDDLSLTHGVLGTAPGGFLKVTDDAPQLQQVHADFDAFAPFVTGEADFRAQTPLRPVPGDDCNGRQRTGKLFADDVTMHYEGYGDQPMFGSQDKAFKVSRFPA
ncbi:MAG TPA: hypothetical protein VID47_05415 [Actinomycetota bacterium]|jgi:hypothetical protein